MAGIVLTCMDALMPRAQGCAEVAYNAFAFLPLHLDVQVPRSTGRARAAVSTIAPALFYLPTSLSVAWRSDAQVPRADGCARAAFTLHAQKSV